MPTKRVFKDPLMTHPAILAYRDAVKMVPNSGYRKDIALTVQDVDLWKEILSRWGYHDQKGKWHKWNPRNISGLLAEYEYRVSKQDEVQPNGSGIHSEESLPERVTGRVPEFRLPVLLERSRGWTG